MTKYGLTVIKKNSGMDFHHIFYKGIADMGWLAQVGKGQNING